MSSPYPPRRVAALAASASLVVALGLAACAPAGGGASAPARPLPAYAGDNADWFDDAIEPHAVGLELEGRTDPRADPRFRARAQTADIVVRARVSTVTSEVGGPSSGYQVGFTVIERLAGHDPVGDEFTVRIDKNSPAFGVVRSFEGRLVGKTLVVFVKAFARPGLEGGERDLHFHAAPDAPETLAAVREAVVLDELK